MNTVRSVWLFASSVVLVACGRNAQPNEPSNVNAPSVCVVLSVGSEKGLSHLGVLTALHDHGVRVDCVAGNSMGALVGGLYAASPNADPVETYQKVMNRYYKQTVRDASFFGVNVVDWERMRSVLRTHLDGQRIEALSVNFLTGYQRANNDGIRYESVRGGVLADELARSIRNPLLFKELKLESGQPFDPGADRLSATPLDEACRAFPDRHFVVSNVTGSEAIVSRDSQCVYDELMIKSAIGHADEQKRNALMGKNPEFTALIQAGYEAAEQKLPWRQLGGVAVAKAPLQFLRLRVESTFAKTKANGKRWDEGFFEGAAPDPMIRVTVESCKTCDTYASSLGRFENKGPSGYSHVAEFVLRVRKGFPVNVEVVDLDGTSEDRLNVLEIVMDGPMSTRKDSEEGTVVVTVSPETGLLPG